MATVWRWPPDRDDTFCRTDFIVRTEREPSVAEADSYIIGESTARRLATYRHLADATLAGKGPDVATGGPATAAGGLARSEARPSGGLSGSTVAYIVIAIAVLVGVYFAARFGVAR